MIEQCVEEEGLEDAEGVEDEDIEDHVFDWDDPETGATGTFTYSPAEEPAAS